MPLSTLEVGKKLVQMVNADQSMQVLDQLYSPNIASIEAHEMQNMPQKQTGIDAIRKKAEWWYANHTIHSGEATGPWPHGDRFIVFFKFDVTSTSGPYAGKRMTIDEAALYTVKDGKIVQEEFFYDMGG